MEVDDTTCSTKSLGTEWRKVDNINERMNNMLASMEIDYCIGIGRNVHQ